MWITPSPSPGPGPSPAHLMHDSQSPRTVAVDIPETHGSFRGHPSTRQRRVSAAVDGGGGGGE